MVSRQCHRCNHLRWAALKLFLEQSEYLRNSLQSSLFICCFFSHNTLIEGEDFYDCSTPHSQTSSSRFLWVNSMYASPSSALCGHLVILDMERNDGATAGGVISRNKRVCGEQGGSWEREDEVGKLFAPSCLNGICLSLDLDVWTCHLFLHQATAHWRSFTAGFLTIITNAAFLPYLL